MSLGVLIDSVSFWHPDLFWKRLKFYLTECRFYDPFVRNNLNSKRHETLLLLRQEFERLWV